MKRLYIAATLLAAAGLCFAGIAVTRASNQQKLRNQVTDPTGPRGSEDMLAALQEQNASHQAAINALSRQVASLHAAEKSDAAVTNVVPSQTSETERDKASSLPPERSAEEKELLRKSDFEGEAMDPGWARPRESSISQFVASNVGRDASLSSVSCRRTTCRIETTHPTAEARDAYLQSMGSHGPEHASAWFRLTGDETSRFSATLYLYAERDAKQEG